MKVLHTADWHFNERDYDEIYKCVSHIVYESNAIKPDLFCISGDITDSKNLSFDSRSARAILHIISDMLNIAPVAIVIGTPSHDGHASLALRECRGKYPILVSDMPEQFIYNSDGFFDRINNDTCPVGNDSFLVSQIPQPTKQYFINDMSIENSDNAISNAMDSIFASFGSVAEKFNTIPHIVNGHGQIGGAFISETQQLTGVDIEVSKSQLKMMNSELICYGHIHKAQDMGDGIFYAGSPTRMNHGETEEKGFYVHNLKIFEHLNDSTAYEEIVEDIDNVRYSLESEFIKTPAIYLHDAKFDMTKNSEILPVWELWCESLQEDYDDWGCKITITAWQDEASLIIPSKIEKMLFEYGAKRAKVLLIRKPRETVRAEKVLEAETLPDKIKAMGELRGEDVKKSILEKAALLESGEPEPWE